MLEVGDYAVRVPVPRTAGEWLGFAARRVRGKIVGLVLTGMVLTLFSFVNCMDLLLGVEATPGFLKSWAKGAADRVSVERKSLHRHGPRLAHLPRGRSLMVVEVTSEVDLERKLDFICEMTGPGGFGEGHVRRTVDPDELPGGIRAGTPVTLEIDFPEKYTPFGACKVIEAR